MKISKVKIDNFRGIKNLEINLLGSRGEPRQITGIIGDNGSGKTTVLQAIALVLSLATRRTANPEEFAWPGFLPDRLDSFGKTFIELEIIFDDVERNTSLELYSDWKKDLWAHNDFHFSDIAFFPPGPEEATIGFSDGRLQSYMYENRGLVGHFLGHYFLKALFPTRPWLREKFKQVGDVYWFDQNRNLSTLLDHSLKTGPDKKGYSQAWPGGVEQLREYLIGWWGYHTSPDKSGGKDYIPELERLFDKIFPGTVFRGIKPKYVDAGGRVSDFYFLLERDGKVFDISEISSGEQAVFPILYEFVRLDISKSIVLIDELELHLHPPQQQALLAALPKLGPDCQFIITTHSPFLENVITEEQLVRLDGDQACL